MAASRHSRRRKSAGVAPRQSTRRLQINTGMSADVYKSEASERGSVFPAACHSSAVIGLAIWASLDRSDPRGDSERWALGRTLVKP
jgi:hypothetical protein